MRVLFVGDVIGRTGRKLVKNHLAQLQSEHSVDFTIVNVENAAGGFGITASLAEEILQVGVDVLTSGNHIWDRKDVFELLPKEPRLLRPANYPSTLPGADFYISERKGARIAVTNLQGRVFMPLIDCPFQTVDRILDRIENRADVIIVDFHAEATSEKMAFGWYVDGRVAAVLGTHTHVPTADSRVLPKGTAYISDVGMTGPYDSVIGMRVEGSMARFLTGVGQRFKPAEGNPRLCSVLIDIDESSGKARSIRRIDR